MDTESKLAQPSSPSSGGSAGIVIHNAFCDSCQFPIVGIRWKCLNCGDLDICSDCEAKGLGASLRSDDGHDSSHTFLKIRFPLPPPSERPPMFVREPVLDRDPSKRIVLHRQTFCDACDRPIVGNRFMCTQCSDTPRPGVGKFVGIDLCESCERAGGLRGHDPRHIFLKLPFATLDEAPRRIEIDLPYPPLDAPSAIPDDTRAVSGRTAQPAAVPPPADPPGPRPDRVQRRDGGFMMTRPFEVNSDLWPVLAIENESFLRPYPQEYFTVRHRDRSLWVAEVEDTRIVGYAAIEFERNSAVLASLAVGAAARGMGVGHNLMVATFEECQRRRVRKLFLHVSVFNGTAMALYHKFGFRPVRWLANYYSDEHEDAVLEVADV